MNSCYTTNKALVSVIIVNYNDSMSIKKCLDSLQDTIYKNVEVIVVDDCSVDESFKVLEGLREQSHFTLLKTPQNIGPAGARNIGARYAHGSILAFLDSDTIVDRGWLNHAVDLMNRYNTVGAIQCKLLVMSSQHFDSVGSFLGWFGFLVQRVRPNQIIDFGQFDKQVRVFSAKSAGMLIKKDLFFAIGGFDDDYFIYLEETDLCWRIWTKGYSVVYVPDSVVYHSMGSALRTRPNDVARLRYFLGTRNYIMTQVKNAKPIGSLLLIILGQIVAWFAMSLLLLKVRKRQEAFSIFKGLFWVFTHMRLLLSKRKQTEKYSTHPIPKEVIMRPSLRYYYETAKIY